LIRLECTNCKQTLEIDDAFAGGVCRCQYCGTIQTVPVAAKGGSGRGPVVKAKTLYRNESRGGSGMDALAQIATSSGLAGSGRLRQAGENSAARAPQPPTKSNLPIIIAASGGVILVLLIVIVVLVSRGGSSSSPHSTPPPPPPSDYTPSANTTPQTPPPAEMPSQTPEPEITTDGTSPRFAGMPLDGKSVVYLIDNGSSANTLIGAMTRVTLESVKSLGGSRQFKVIFWAGDDMIYPESGMASETESDQAGVQAVLSKAYTKGSTNITHAMQLAIAENPATIVIVTAKGPELPEKFLRTVLSIRGTNPAKIYTVGIDGDTPIRGHASGVLSRLAQKTGGQFLSISAAELSHW